MTLHIQTGDISKEAKEKRKKEEHRDNLPLQVESTDELAVDLKRAVRAAVARLSCALAKERHPRAALAVGAAHSRARWDELDRREVHRRTGGEQHRRLLTGEATRNCIKQWLYSINEA